jgi:putative heme transporter
MSYYVGTLGSTLLLLGGIGGVEGGMIGSLVAFGVNGSLAVLAVLGYRTISYWLPTVPGAIAYVRLRRSAAPKPHS